MRYYIRYARCSYIYVCVQKEHAGVHVKNCIEQKLFFFLCVCRIYIARQDTRRNEVLAYKSRGRWSRRTRTPCTAVPPGAPSSGRWHSPGSPGGKPSPAPAAAATAKWRRPPPPPPLYVRTLVAPHRRREGPAQSRQQVNAHARTQEIGDGY